MRVTTFVTFLLQKIGLTCASAYSRSVANTKIDETVIHMSIALTYETFGSPCINVDCCCEIVKNVAMLRVTRAGAIWSLTQKDSQLKTPIISIQFDSVGSIKVPDFVDG